MASTGYASNGSLTTHFKRHFGVSPGIYRATDQCPAGSPPS